MAPHNPVTESDLNAYVDDQLTPDRRIDVEAYLSTHGEDAMRVMADLRIKDALRHCAQTAVGDAAPARTIRLARRLDRARFRGRVYARLRPIAVTTLLVTIGWLGHAGYATLSGSEEGSAQASPAFVDDAIRAHRTSLTRAAMVSQPESPLLDSTEILNNLGIVMPQLPDEFSVRDVQVFPSSSGPGVEIVIETGGLRSLSIFAVRSVSGSGATGNLTGSGVKGSQTGTDATGRSAVKGATGRLTGNFGDARVVYWQQGPWSYALTSESTDADLDQLADKLSFAAAVNH